MVFRRLSTNASVPLGMRDPTLLRPTLSTSHPGARDGALDGPLLEDLLLPRTAAEEGPDGGPVAEPGRPARDPLAPHPRRRRGPDPPARARPLEDGRRAGDAGERQRVVEHDLEALLRHLVDPQRLERT